MNDFTKEELKVIMEMYKNGIPGTYIEGMGHLIIKIQSMIDNYCEHESDGYTYYKSGDRWTDFLVYACSNSPCLLKCKKCGELFDDGRP